MEKLPHIIKGGNHTDVRGTISFMNDFDMSEVKRFYIITHSDTIVKRGWRGHKIEQRWFYVTQGEFLVSIAKIGDFSETPSSLVIEEFLMSASSTEILHVPPGYATLIQAVRASSSLLVFADYGIEHAQHDDHVYPFEHFTSIKKL
ncbi:MAG: sugar epimerase [Flavobacterium sp.]|nr:MAG: sugar epimerase [Flavobacterium sp.]